jgi:hypothetical protein
LIGNREKKKAEEKEEKEEEKDELWSVNESSDFKTLFHPQLITLSPFVPTQPSRETNR